MTGIDLPDGEYTAVVDGVEDGLATVFFERDGDEVGDAVLDASRLPPDGGHADAVLSVTLDGGRIEAASYEPEETERRAEAAQDRFDRLSERPPSDEGA
ncbi:DUF3006 family protein [Halorubrum ezzemoulense]|jgi:hypothetical protein|uniref:DUF3006 domain-containing protein n=2 Tax=Halorubrum ezzemoulense TaxID=337243 RepID=A0A256KEE1_HALEZ|nr:MULTISPECIES: DUF3006 domain-containing protein [Halorubrum]MDB2223230.1 DUF3006 family protein [Halorubrum ezzemoulense]MDB2240602.1 DUF3006 family protein [Halorubrum ezzemoulense]MDB2243520.1 DUF3006 family protein [Halorubrum ezzemoulense]MDB2251586.1 DUF3006 family protein [Halorubrum ezzemoulense]MDB2260990.1 DUF3006 family protein [Halorubrum ezzemoulense]